MRPRVPLELRVHARQLLNDLMERFPLSYTPQIHWNGRLRVSAGMAYYVDGVIGLSPHLLTDKERLESTLIHEYAHLLAIHRHGRRAAGHGSGWRQAMLDLGQSPTVHHNYPVERNTKSLVVAYQCERCGEMIYRGRRFPRRRVYQHIACGGRIRFAWSKRITPTAEPA